MKRLQSERFLKNVVFTFVEDYFGCMESVYNHHFELLLSRTYVSGILTGCTACHQFNSFSHSSIMGKYFHLNCSHCVYICTVFSFLIWFPDKMENQFFSDFFFFNLTDAVICFFLAIK